MKIAGLVVGNVFVQADTVDGYGFLDHKGAVINRWHREFPQLQTDRDSVTLVNNDSAVRQFKVTPKQIWIHFELPDTLTYVADQSWRLIEATSDLIGVTKFSRFGARTAAVFGVEGARNFGDRIRHRLLSDTVTQFLATQAQNRLALADLTLNWAEEKLSFNVGFRSVELQSGSQRAANFRRKAT